MDISLEQRPSFAVAVVDLDADETLLAEGDAMTSISGNVGIETKRMTVGGESEGALGAIAGAVGQMLAGESFLVNHLTAQGTQPRSFCPQHCRETSSPTRLSETRRS
ncbi:hypothetical protein BSZ35_13930 [Salinibacter sp. 10B]|uniref:AIM24 family protein n=1 Tax=Salinibacter sp. 10B TaxID=1923971 RepID=UPI000D2E7175|nr:AIM24 family protein [Salinibacter sp. 10B]PQJ35557.1 hypothetical protein BSZ35_13930 [Salinibacter sp. 10B]